MACRTPCRFSSIQTSLVCLILNFSIFHQWDLRFQHSSSSIKCHLVWVLVDTISEHNASFHWQVTVEWPYVLVQSLIYGTIVYSMIQFEWTAAKYFYFIFFMYFTLLYFTYWGMVTVAITPNSQFAAIISSAFYGLWNLFSGFLIPRPVSTSPWMAIRHSCIPYILVNLEQLSLTGIKKLALLCHLFW